MIFLLDLDATLLDFPRAERENFQKSLLAHGIEPTEERYQRFHVINDGLWKALERGEVTRERLKVLRFQMLFCEDGVKKDAFAVSETYFRGFETICYPYDGAKEFLQTLSSLGRCYLVTNGGAAIQHSHIRLAGFSPYLTGAFISEEIGADKPSKAFSDYVISHIEAFRREETILIGDSFTSDGKCAEGMGVEFYRFDPEQDPKKQYEDILKRVTRV